uniref:Neural EGFL like 2 n=1 Tax=Oncorhynchus mykiss TaxID=8022 RepID=A0A8C7RR01_ONCMY
MGLKLFIFLGLFCVTSVLGFGVDPALCINVFDELTLGEGFDGVTQVQGFHSESRAFHFQGSSREVKAPEDVSERMLQKLRGRREFTVVVTLKQEHFNSGVILSIHHSEQRFLELESSGQRNEVRLHYRTKGQKAHTEVFPYSLADGQWHKVSVAVSASHIILHVDCNRIYERVVEIPFMDIPEDTTFWLGQRSSAHGFFKGVMQDVQILVMPQGFISQCPDLNRTCPTCNDFHGLVQKIMELQDILAKTSSKLSRAEEMMNSLDGCYCERTCSVKGVVYREDESLTDGCRNCTCTVGYISVCVLCVCTVPIIMSRPPLSSLHGYVSLYCPSDMTPVCLSVSPIHSRDRWTAGPCCAPMWTVNSRWCPRANAVPAASLIPARPTPYATTSPRRAWTSTASSASAGPHGSNTAPSAPSASAR